MATPVQRVLMIAALATAPCGCQPDADTAATTTTPQNSHARMIARLEQVSQRARIDDPYFQSATIEQAESRLAALPSGYEVERLTLHLSLAEDFRRLGDNDRAVEHMQAVERLVAAAGFRTTPEQQNHFLFEMGLTWLRLGETENCVHCRTGESCILPIQGTGIHQHQRGSRHAIEYFTQLLRRDPGDLRARWLLNIACMTVGDYPDNVPTEFLISPSAFQATESFPRFIDVATETGLKTFNCGGGAVAEDFDDDGWIDILTSTWDPAGQLRFFRNRGDGRFLESTSEAGLDGLLGGINLVQADYDNDGLVDVLVLRGAWLGEVGRQPNSLLKNLGGGRFRDVTFDVGLGEFQLPTSSASWADYDNDGDLDLYVGNEGPPCQLLRNDGPRGFTDVAAAAGVKNQRYAKAVIWGDYDGDGRPDLYVSNFSGENRLYHNNGDGTFADVAQELDVDRPLLSFPAWFWDVNNDGVLDLYVASYEIGLEHIAADYLGLPRHDEPDRLYLGLGDGTFHEAADAWGLTRSTQPMGSNFGDLDNDGFPDFYLGTGYPGYEALMPNLMFHNQAGRGFVDVTFTGGFGHLQKGHGVAFADLDNDGDQDVFAQVGGAYPGDAFGNVLFENPGFHNHWIRIKLVGNHSNRSGIGARIRADIVDGATRRSVYKWVNSGGSFGASPLEPQIGLGQAGRIDVLEIHWPTSGQTQRFEKVPVDSFIEVEEGRAEYRVLDLPRASFPRSVATAEAGRR